MDDTTYVLAAIEDFTIINKHDTVSALHGFVNEENDEWDLFLWSKSPVYLMFEMRMKKKWMSHLWVYYSCFVPCLLLTLCSWESMDKYLSGNFMFISDWKTIHVKFDSMDVYTWISIDGEAAHFLLWMTLASCESYINIIESQMSIDRKIAILPNDWYVFNNFYWWQQCLALHHYNSIQWACDFRQRSEVVSWWGYSWLSWYLVMVS